jgi:osmotically-inducible protein OsmY
MIRSILALLLAVPLWMGALAVPAGATTFHNSAASARTGTPSDSQIDATIRAKLAKSKIGREGFQFKVQRGVVTWEGTTDVMQHKGSATRMAKSAGAVQVVNNIQVSGTGKSKSALNLKRATVKTQ